MELTTYTTDQLRDYSSLFSRRSAIKWSNGDISSIKLKVGRYNPKWAGTNKSYFDYMRYVYKILEVNYQNEYIFKNAFLNARLIEDFLKPDIKSFNEFRVGNSVADLAVFNGKSVAFEVKTGMDSCKRLNDQIKSYKEIFNETYLIIPESKLATYLKYDVGIIVFDSSKKEFKYGKKAPTLSLYEINSNSIMNVLHTSEYKFIVKEHYGSLPKSINSFNQFELCAKLINKISVFKLNKYFIYCMKQRGVASSDLLAMKQFKEFKQLGNALKMNKAQYRAMVQRLKRLKLSEV